MSHAIWNPRGLMPVLCIAITTTALACGGRDDRDRSESSKRAAARTNLAGVTARVDPCTGHELTDDKRPRVAAVDVSFFLDRDLTRGLYLGARWVSPPTYTVISRDPANTRIELRAAVRDRGRRSLAGKPAWESADPGMVAVAPERGEDVMLSVTRPGSTTVEVTCGDATRVLAIDASYTRDRSLKVAISRR